MTTGQAPKLRLEPKVHPPGTVGVVSSDLSRYANFSIAMLHLDVPEGSKLAWEQGADITGNTNGLVNFFRRTDSNWLWMIGDDHVFHPDLLIRLLEHEVDVVVPFCLKRGAPFDPVLYSGQNDKGEYLAIIDPPDSGLIEVHAAGNAGMLVRKHVLEAIPDPVFETKGGQNEDLIFCEKVREAGFKIWADIDTPLGHIGTMCSWPDKMEDGSWGIRLDIGDGQQVPLRRIRKGPSLTAA